MFVFFGWHCQRRSGQNAKLLWLKFYFPALCHLISWSRQNVKMANLCLFFSSMKHFCMYHLIMCITTVFSNVCTESAFSIYFPIFTSSPTVRSAPAYELRRKYDSVILYRKDVLTTNSIHIINLNLRIHRAAISSKKKHTRIALEPIIIRRYRGSVISF